MGNTVFISYSSKDEKMVEQIVSILEEAGFSYWKAPEMIPAGSNYAREIPRAIEGCEIFLLLLSESSQTSIWVEKEVDCAINYRKTIVPINLTGTVLSDMFRFYLNNVQIISFCGNREIAAERLRQRLYALLPSKGTEGAGKEKIQASVVQTSEAGKEEKLQIPESYGQQSVKIVPRKLSPEAVARERQNALSVNQSPVVCQKCGGELKLVERGTYQCVECGFYDYDSFQKIRNYLNQMGPRPITEICRATGVPRKSIEYFLRDERLEIPAGSPVLLMCEGCGAGIRSGRLCNKCRDKNTKTVEKKTGDSRYRFMK